MSDLRSNMGDALEHTMPRERLDELLEAVLAITKTVYGEFSCKHCGRAQKQPVQVADAKAVAGALKDLNAEAWGRPSDDKTEDASVTVVRKIFYNGAEDE